MNNYDISSLIALVKSNQRCILAVDGLSRSGKTTFVENLRVSLKKEGINSTIFHIDDYIVKRSQRYDTGFEEWYEYFYLQWDVEKLRKNLFEKLKECNYVELQFYDSRTDKHDTRKIKLPQGGLIIIEGVFLQRNEWKDFYDKVLFLNCSRQERFDRELEKVKLNREKFEKRYWKAEEYYINTFNPIKLADSIIET
ncbi:kinase [Sutcliffiella horikoshii]|uniref:kinase n=1 Tax=Sutcliffiella horikoshii TaxID=79883 RepID=UPI003CED6D1E